MKSLLVEHYHADNVAPIIFGGITLVRTIDDLDIIPLPTPRRP